MVLVIGSAYESEVKEFRALGRTREVAVSSARTLFLMRHGLTAWNVEMRYQSRSDPGLCDAASLGVSQRADRLRDVSIGACITSPALRARQTVDLLMASGAISEAVVEVSDELREVDFGDFEGYTKSELESGAQAEAYKDWKRTDAGGSHAPGGERWTDAAERARRVLVGVAARPEAAVLVVAHSYILRLVIVAGLGDMPPQAMRRFVLDNAAVSALEHAGDGSWRLVFHNW